MLREDIVGEINLVFAKVINRWEIERMYMQGDFDSFRAFFCAYIFNHFWTMKRKTTAQMRTGIEISTEFFPDYSSEDCIKLVELKNDLLSLVDSSYINEYIHNGKLIKRKMFFLSARDKTVLKAILESNLSWEDDNLSNFIKDIDELKNLNPSSRMKYLKRFRKKMNKLRDYCLL
jgi:hypothetical protein